MKKTITKQLTLKKLPKADREKALLFGLIELYLQHGRAIGSQTILEHGFDHLSSATIRNYFARLEEKGLLKQPHTSGGRIPTEKAFRAYIDAKKDRGFVEKPQENALKQAFSVDTKEVATLLHRGANTLAELSGCAVFISSPRFDQDFIQSVKLVPIDKTKILAILITDFGVVHTELIYLDKSFDAPFLTACEEYFLWRMNQGEKPLFQEEKDRKQAQKIYNEIMVRHVVGYANFPNEEILRTGLSKLLSYPEFNDASSLANSLSLLEDESVMRSLLRESMKENILKTWVGDELYPMIAKNSEVAVLAIPYTINHAIVGSVAILGPMRLPYRNLFGLCQLFSEKISDALTANLYKYKISFRQPTSSEALIENKRKNTK